MFKDERRSEALYENQRRFRVGSEWKLSDQKFRNISKALRKVAPSWGPEQPAVDALVKAAIEGDIARVESLIEDGVDVNSFAEDPRGERGRLDLEITALMAAAEGGYVDIIKVLLDAGADYRAINGDVKSVLMFGASSGNPAMVKVLLEAGALTKHWTSINSMNALSFAAEAGCVESIKLLLEAGVKLESPGDTALICAVRQGHIEVVQYLINAGANVNVGGGKVENPLTLAVEQGSLEMVQALVAGGANVNGGGKRSARVRVQEEEEDSEEEEGEEEVEEEEDFSRTPLMVAAGSGRLDIIKVLLDAGADVNEYNNEMETFIICAARNNQPDVIRLLADAGADINARDSEHATALIYAARSGAAEAAMVLIELGADVTRKSAHINDWMDYLADHLSYFPGLTAIMQATTKEVFDALIAGGATLYKKHKRKARFALLKAAENNNLFLVDKLIEAGIDVNAICPDKKTPALVAAAKSGAFTVAQHLLAAGADVNARDKDKRTALFYAFSCLPLLEALLAEIPDLSVLDKEGRSPLVYTLFESSSLEGVKLLLKGGADIFEIVTSSYMRYYTPSRQEEVYFEREIDRTTAAALSVIPSAVPEPVRRQIMRHLRGFKRFVRKRGSREGRKFKSIL